MDASGFPLPGLISADRLTAVTACADKIATSVLRSRVGLGIVVADSHTGETIGELSWLWSDFSLRSVAWLDDKTLLVSTRPYFLLWRPATGEVFRATDAHALQANGYWQVSAARPVR